MKAPIHKKLISYFTPIVCDQIGSAYNPQLNVLLNKGEYQLCTEDAVYSYGYKYLNFHDTFKKLDWNTFKPKTALLLGLGLGSIPRILENKFQKDLDYTAVEIDEEIVHLAHKYVLNDLNAYLELFICDAYDFMQTNEKQYDLIAMDIFQSADIPPKFQDQLFLSLLKNALSQNGLLIYNRMATTDKDLKENRDFDHLFKSNFKAGNFIKIKYNHMYISNMNLLK